MENEKALKALEHMNKLGYLKGDDKRWFEKLINEPNEWKLWVDGADMQISHSWDTEDFEYGFNVGLNDIGLAVLNYVGIRYDFY